MTFSHLTHTLSANTLWDIRVGRFVYSRKDDPSTGSWTTPNRFDRFTGVNSGAPPQVGGLTLIRTTAKATLSTPEGVKQETSSAALARCTRGTWCRHAWASPPSSA